jgi:hypothetical protein
VKIASSYNVSNDTQKALKDAYADLEARLGGPPTWMAVHTTFQHPPEVVLETLKTCAPGVPFQGGTSCLGVMTEAGYHSDNGTSMGLFGIRDPEGSYGVGHSERKSYPRQSGKEAIADALRMAKRDVAPAVIWITCAPGDEEEFLHGIEDGLAGKKLPAIIGGSSADNTIEGKWYQITNDQIHTNGVVVTAMYPSRPIHYAFDNGYTPTEHNGIITKASGRVIYEINHKPAAEVYNSWTNGLITEYMDGGNILSPSTLKPLGRVANWVRGTTLYQLSHPETVLENRALSLFTKAEPGERLVLMESSVQELVYRVDKITTAALKDLSTPNAEIAGGLIIYCAGCMLAVKDEIKEVAKQFQTALKGQPFLGLYTFGEQGCALVGENRHANLMMSVIVFEQ